MKLFYRKMGEGHPLIILHGLYGCSDNWYSVGKSLSKNFTVFIPDLRNHGNSFHSSVHNYKEMSEDIFEFTHFHQLVKPHILGHSMGGKLAVFISKYYPELPLKTIVADISPFDYNLNADTIEHYNILNSLKKINIDVLCDYKTAETELEKYFDDYKLRLFLLKNLQIMKDGKVSWKINISVLTDNLPEIFKGISKDEVILNDFLFIKGEKSYYLRLKEKKAIAESFPNSDFIILHNAGHWLHAEEPEKFITIVSDYFQK